jgi:phosphatidate cytidylyltransferase
VASAGIDPSLRLRLLSAVALVPIALLLVVVGGWGFTGFVELAVALMALEWARLTSARHGRRSGVFAGAAVFAVGFVSTLLIAFEHTAVALGTLVLGALVAGLIALTWGGPGLWIALGVGYVGLPALALIWLRAVPELGLSVLVWLLIVVWTTDTAAYFTGRRLGGPRLAPRISPGKTWSGFVGGIVGAGVASVVVVLALGSTRVAYAALLGAVLAVVAQIGDLVESALKRRAGVKDSGSLIPGHGGLFDRVDSLLLAAPVLALLALLLGPSAWPWP